MRNYMLILITLPLSSCENSNAPEKLVEQYNNSFINENTEQDEYFAVQHAI
ncbi:hypothetical protein [uncultured Draconibacterium sp.]|uniref:hypothetical protein n=1 Tax=uncultured Draconibacterium sp. TaxID=1573823 RepID=UPI003217F3D2